MVASIASWCGGYKPYVDDGLTSVAQHLEGMQDRHWDSVFRDLNKWRPPEAKPYRWTGKGDRSKED